jgi:hypothetical protein
MRKLKIYSRSVLDLLIPAAVVLFLMTTGCSKNPVEKYRNDLEKYPEGNADREVVAESFFKAFGEEKPGSETLFFNKRVILNSVNDSIEIVFPEKVKLKIDKSIRGSVEYADTGTEIIVLGNKSGFYVFDIKGDYISSYKTEGKEKIEAVAVSGGSVLFLKDHLLYSYSSADQRAVKFIDGTFSPPYRIYYKADMIVQGNYLAIITGIAGTYYISVINTETASVKMKNIAASSFEFAFTEDEVICIKGTSGKWSLNRYEYKIKSNEKLTPLGKLSAIYLTQHGYVLEQGDDIIIYDFENNRISVPFDCTVSGRSRNSLIVRFRENNYIIDFSVFSREMADFNKKIPDFRIKNKD